MSQRGALRLVEFTDEEIGDTDLTPGNKLPLIVDLDGTLLKTDCLMEQIARTLFTQPLKLFRSLDHLRDGKASFKRALALLCPLEITELPMRQALVAYLEDEYGTGRKIHLVSAADRSIVEQVGEQLGLFESVHGSDPGHNLKGIAKLDFLQTRFPEGFVYAGDSQADIAVWEGSNGIILAGASSSVSRHAQTLDAPIEHEFDTGSIGITTWMEAMRLHQWSKNLLLFIPLLLSPALSSLSLVLTCLMGFIVMSLLRPRPT